MSIIGTRASQFGLTGCVTFSDIVLQSIKIEIPESFCEDGLHFVRSFGNINFLEVSGAMSMLSMLTSLIYRSQKSVKLVMTVWTFRRVTI